MGILRSNKEHIIDSLSKEFKINRTKQKLRNRQKFQWTLLFINFRQEKS